MDVVEMGDVMAGGVPQEMDSDMVQKHLQQQLGQL